MKNHKVCPTCKQWETEYNVAVANGLILKARAVERRLMAHYQSTHHLSRKEVWQPGLGYVDDLPNVYVE